MKKTNQLDKFMEKKRKRMEQKQKVNMLTTQSWMRLQAATVLTVSRVLKKWETMPVGILISMNCLDYQSK